MKASGKSGAQSGEPLFVYGTLLVPEVMQAVIGRRPPGRSATLEGYARFTMRGETFPAIIAQVGSETEGLLCDGISPHEIRRLDDFEGEQYARVGVDVMLESGARTHATTYALLPAHFERLTDQPWDCERFAAHELPRFMQDEFD